MSSLEDGNTPVAIVPGPDAAEAAPNASASKEIRALPTPAELASGAVIISTQEIRAEVLVTIRIPSVWDAIADTLQPQGTEGSVQYDHHRVATTVMENSAKLQAISGMKPFVLWQHIQAVLRAKPLFYIVDRGYIIGRREKDEVA